MAFKNGLLKRDKKKMIAESIITSVVASIIFTYTTWLIKFLLTRKNALENMNKISQELLFYLECPFLHNKFCSSSYQELIYDNSLSSYDYRMALSTKCMNEVNEIPDTKNVLMPIGDNLIKHKDEIISRISDAYRYSDGMFYKEYKFLSEIEESLKKYDYKLSVDEILPGKIAIPVNPSIGYMADTFKQLNGYYVKLSKITNNIFTYKERYFWELLRRYRTSRVPWRRYFFLNKEKRVFVKLKNSINRGDIKASHGLFDRYLSLNNINIAYLYLILDDVLNDDYMLCAWIYKRGIKEVSQFVDNKEYITYWRKAIKDSGKTNYERYNKV